jgi:hypothetical protein
MKLKISKYLLILLLLISPCLAGCSNGPPLARLRLHGTEIVGSAQEMAQFIRLTRLIENEDARLLDINPLPADNRPFLLRFRSGPDGIVWIEGNEMRYLRDGRTSQDEFAAVKVPLGVCAVYKLTT